MALTEPSGSKTSLIRVHLKIELFLDGERVICFSMSIWTVLSRRN